MVFSLLNYDKWVKKTAAVHGGSSGEKKQAGKSKLISVSVLLPERFGGKPPCTFGTQLNEILQSVLRHRFPFRDSDAVMERFVIYHSFIRLSMKILKVKHAKIHRIFCFRSGIPVVCLS